MKLKKIAIALVSLVLLSSFPLSVLAETILEKIERTGEMNGGARKDAIPFGYVNAQGKWAGYSVDLLHLIHKQVEKKLKKKIKLNLKEATIDNRFALVQQGTVDIVCGATTITQERLKKVDFSQPFFMTGAQFLVKLEDAPTFDFNGTLVKVPIAFIPGTTTQEIIPQIYPFADWKVIKSRQEGIKKLKNGEVQAVVSDGVLLIGELVQQGGEPQKFVLMPRQPITTELYACILPKNNQAWKDLVDLVVVGIENRELKQKWFSAKTGRFPYIVPDSP